MDVGPQAYLTLNTYLIPTPPLQVQVQAGDVVVSGTVSITGKVDISGNTFSNGNLKTLDSGVYKPTNNGVNSHFAITASAVNNAAVYYTDETKGVDVAGGWEFTSTNAGTRNTQINWYMYQPTTDVVITDLSNNPTNTYYTIVDNVGVEFPMIYVYTKPTTPATKTTGGTAGSSWYQSKFVYQADQAGTVGTYLLYAGKNPTTIRPDLIHINLRQLDSLCLGTLQPDELVLFGALLTSSNLQSPPGNFSLTMSQFGVVIAPVDTTLRTDATGALVTAVTGAVSVTNLPIVDGGHPCVAVSVDAWTAGTSVPIVIDTDGNTIKIDPSYNAVDISGVVDVSGIFWQTTQPVSIAADLSCNVLNFPASQAVTGAFYPATQAVSIATDLSCNVLNFPASQAVTGAFYPATQAVSGTFYPAVQDVSGVFWQATQPVSIATLPALATGTNSIGKVSEITGVVTTKITNSIHTNARVLDLSVTGHVVKATPGTLRGITCCNADNVLYVYVKIYDKATAPTSADTPICTIPVVKNTTETYDFFYLQMNSGISIRASGVIADNDNTSVSNCSVFVSYDGV
jgi:hypothetical protein